MDIPVPPGVEGMQPKLSLEYNSHGGNGYLGRGWSIGGLSVITRCPSNERVDGKIRAVKLDAKDQYCMNGQRLIEIARGDNYIEYRAEINNYSKIVAHQSDSSNYGPESWSVYSKDGLIYEYGVVRDNDAGEENYSKIVANYKDVDTSKSRSISQSIDADEIVISWAVSTIKDRTESTNAIDFYYNLDEDNKERYIKKIKYSGGEVEFNYNSDIDRRDTITGYLAGSKYNITKLLVGIDIKDLLGSKIESYSLKYLTNELYTKLTTIEHSIGSAKVKPLDISWSKEDFETTSFEKLDDQTFDIKNIIGFADFENSGSMSLVVTNPAPINTIADINGDGFVDEIIYDFNGDKKFLVRYGGVNSNNNFVEFATNLGSFISEFMQMADVNGDGKSDFVATTSDGDMYVALSKGDSFESAKKVIHIDNLKEIDTPMYLVDLNRDSLVDIIHFSTNFVEISYNNNGVFEEFQTITDLNNAFTQEDGWSGKDENGYEKYPRRFADINGDGYLDIVGFADNGVRVSINAGNGFETPYMASNTFGYAKGWREKVNRRILADMNGDGYVDIVACDNDKTYIFYGTANRDITGFALAIEIDDFSNNQGWTKESYRNVYDINNDGTLDLVGYKPSTDGDKGTVVMYRSSKRFVAVTGFDNHKDHTVKINYASLLKSIYKKGDELSGKITLTPAMQVVFQTGEYDSGNSKANSMDEYFYEGYRVDKDRRSLGFETLTRVHKTADNPDSIQNITTYYQEFPYIGMVKSNYSGFDIMDDINSGEVISYSSTTMGYKTSYLNVYDIFSAQTYEEDKLTGVVTKSTSDIKSDGSGDITKIEIQKYQSSNPSAVYTTKTVNEYTDNLSSWLIGRLSKTTVEHKDPQGDILTKVSAFEYDPTTGMLIKETIEPNQTKTLSKTYKYDKYGNKISESITGYKLAEGIKTTYEYSQEYKGRFLTKATNAKGYSQTNRYDPSTGRVVSTTDANGNEIVYSYDLIGKKIKEVSTKDQIEINYAHQWETYGIANGLYSVVKYGTNTPVTITVYDKEAREVALFTQDINNNRVSLSQKAYSIDGTLKEESLPYKDGDSLKKILYSYNRYKQLTSKISPSPDGDGDIVTTLTYEGLKTTTTVNNLTTVVTKDIKGKIVEVEDPENGTLRYSYYPDGRLKSTTDSKNNTINLTYDLLGYKLSMNDPDMGEWFYDHDALGREIKIVTPNSRVSFMKYDNLGRVYEKYIKGYTYRWVYDDITNGKKGNLKYESKTRTSDEELRYKRFYTYDERGRVERVTHKIFIEEGYAYENYTTKYSYYDDTNKIKDLTYPNNLTIRHYYKNGYLYKIKDADSKKELYQIKSTDAYGNISQAVMAEDINEIYEYNSIGKLITQKATVLDNEKIYLKYSYNKRGLLQSKYDKYIGKATEGLKESYSYDNLGRLTEVQVDSSLLADNEHLLNYSYDKLGNLTQKIDLAISYKTTKAHQIDRVNGVTYIYDNNGNLIKDDRHEFKYDPNDKVISIVQDDNNITFEYSTTDQRYQKRSNNGFSYTNYIDKQYIIFDTKIKNNNKQKLYRT